MTGTGNTLAGLALEQRRALELRLLERRAAQAAPSIEPRQGECELPLSFAQQRLWFMHQLDPRDCGYNLQRVLRVRGPLDVPRLRRALEVVQERHEALRTSFPATDGRPRQAIAPPGPLALQVSDLTNADPAVREARLREVLAAAVGTPFDLTAGPIFRALVVRLAAEDNVVAVMMHHIAGDEWSLRILNQEIATAYAGDEAKLPPLPIQYADFALWQRRWLESGNGAVQLDYWRRQLAGLPQVLEIIQGRTRQPVQALRGARHVWRIAPETVTRLDGFAQESRVTPFMLSLAAFAVLLQRYSRRDDIVVGTPVSGRQRSETQLLVGFFANTVALRMDASEDPTFREFLQRVRSCVLDGFANQDVPFEKVVDALAIRRSRSHGPVFQVLFTHRNELGNPLEGSGLDLSPVSVDDGVAKCDLWLAIEDSDRGRQAMLEVDAMLFDVGATERMAGHFDRLLAAIAARPDAALSELDILAPHEKETLTLWSGAAAAMPISGSIAALFAARVAEAADAIAVCCGDDEVSYGALDRWSTRLAHRLRAEGIGPERVVAIAAPRTPALIAGLLAIVKAGGAYLPIDASLPTTRIDFMLRDTGAALVLATEEAMPALRGHGVKTLRLDPTGADLSADSDETLIDATGPATLAYVMYTSGSTGTPKAAAIEQRGVIRLVRDTAYARFGADERILQLAPVSFDASTFEIWGALLNGGCLVQVPVEKASLVDISRTIVAGRVTTLWLTAGLFQQMVDHALDCFTDVGQVLAGGDVLSVAHVRRFRAVHPACRLINGYGPTESTTFACTYEVDDDAALEPSVPIGRPIANTEVRVLDPQLRPVGIGMAGELCIGGAGLARGYLNRPELTAERFVVAPGAGERLYRTGDLVRFRADGTLQFLGRLDRQLKLRGFRIEPGEIEAALLDHRAVKQAVVALRADERGEARLIAHCVVDPQLADPATELLAHLRRQLPGYMIPAAIGFLHALPLTAQGKVDVAALPDVQVARHDTVRRAPRDALEQQLVALWERLLDVTGIGIDDDFFALGGHSLLAAELFAHLDRLLTHPLPLATIFDAPTIATLAERVRAVDADRRAWPQAVRMPAVDAHRPLFAVPGIGGNVVGFAALSRRLASERPLIGLTARGLDERETPHTTIEEIAREHVAEIRRHQAHGPYDLLGACIGGVVAYEIAQQLSAAGERIDHLLLLDPAFRGAALPAGERRARRDDAERPDFAGFVARRARVYAAELSQLPARAWGGYALEKMRALRDAQADGRLAADVRRELAQSRVIAAHRQALKAYAPRPFAGAAIVFRSADRRASIDRVLSDLRGLCGGRLTVEIVPGFDSGSALQEPNVETFVARMRARLAAEAGT
jgi:amino acid adenylation domain-containing protein